MERRAKWQACQRSAVSGDEAPSQELDERCLAPANKRATAREAADNDWVKEFISPHSVPTAAQHGGGVCLVKIKTKFKKAYLKIK